MVRVVCRRWRSDACARRLRRRLCPRALGRKLDVVQNGRVGGGGGELPSTETWRYEEEMCTICPLIVRHNGNNRWELMKTSEIYTKSVVGTNNTQ